MTLLEAVDLLRGKPGTTVQLHIKRKGKDVFEKILTRAIIHVKPIKWHAEGNIGYIRISTFNEETLPQLKAAVAES
jgi:carboxyl-terminal processing protease